MKENIRPRVRNIIEFIEASNKREDVKKLGISTYEVVDHIHGSYRNTLRILNDLHKRGYIRRVPGNGHSYNWKFRSWNPAIHEELPTSLEAKTVKSWISIVTQPNWKANYAKDESWSRVPQVALDLSGLASAASRGEAIDPKQLERARNELYITFSEVERAYKILGGLLKTDELWDSKSISAFLES